jgi:hypothetical protein
VRRFRHNADAEARRRERRHAAGDPQMANAVVADKLRSEHAAQITLGELAGLTDPDLQRALPPDLVSACVRSILSPAGGFFYGSPAYRGMIGAMLKDRPPRVAPPEVVARMIELQDQDRIIVDVLAPSWLLFKPSRIEIQEGGDPVLYLVMPHGWLDEEVRATLGGDPEHAVLIHVEGVGYPDLQGPWLCVMDLDMEDQ